jgi:excisionase family DNA binding protein
MSNARPEAEQEARPAYMTRGEAAAYLRVHKTFLERLDREARGPRVMRLGRVVRYARADLDAWMDAHAKRGDAA